eukprot:11205788-Lingulodinium_polyedra.AAC.1
MGPLARGADFRLPPAARSNYVECPARNSRAAGLPRKGENNSYLLSVVLQSDVDRMLCKQNNHTLAQSIKQPVNQS